jgi:hypothetical protein
LSFRLPGGVSLVPIYILVEFGTFWASPSAGPKYWSLIFQHDVPSRTYQAAQRGWAFTCCWHLGSSHCIQPLEAYFVLSGAFCSNSYHLSIGAIRGLFQICSILYQVHAFHNKGQSYACVLHILSIVVILHVLSRSYTNLV